MTCIRARSVEVDVDQERGQAAQHGQPDGAPGHPGRQWPEAEEHGGGGQGKDAGAGVLPAGWQQPQGGVGEELAGMGGTQDRIPGQRSGGGGQRAGQDDGWLAGACQGGEGGAGHHRGQGRAVQDGSPAEHRGLAPLQTVEDDCNHGYTALLVMHPVENHEVTVTGPAVAPAGSARVGSWVLLAYRLPREPSNPRVGVWRKLERLGVARLGDGLVALPADARTREQLDWLAEEILEAGGTSTVWLATPGSAAHERTHAPAMRAAPAGEYQGG